MVLDEPCGEDEQVRDLERNLLLCTGWVLVHLVGRKRTACCLGTVAVQQVLQLCVREAKVEVSEMRLARVLQGVTVSVLSVLVLVTLDTETHVHVIGGGDDAFEPRLLLPHQPFDLLRAGCSVEAQVVHRLQVWIVELFTSLQGEAGMRHLPIIVSHCVLHLQVREHGLAALQPVSIRHFKARVCRRGSDRHGDGDHFWRGFSATCRS